jgi:serine phosphatase RsbU (regulator of sigma subunit)/pSer/pThr/pTyr-binding forkhead associated (FHA) protein
MPSIVVLTGEQKDEVFELRGGETLGRDPGNSIQINAPGISRKHLQFVREGGAMWLVDLGSANGTVVGGARVNKHKLRDGDVLLLSQVSLRFQASDDTRSNLARPKLRAREDPPTEPVDTERARRILLEEESKTERQGADFSIDARLSFTQTAVNLSHKDQVGTLQKRLQAIFDVQQALAAVKDRDELLGTMMDKLFETFPQAHHGLVLLGPTVDELEPAIVRSRDKTPKPAATHVSRTIAREVFEQRKAILAHDTAEDARFSHASSVVNMEIHSFVVAPLLFRDEVLGFIQLDSQRTKSRFMPEDLSLLAGLASSAALFLKSLKLFETVAREVREREARNQELRVASRIQAGLLPKSDPEDDWLEISGRMRTAKEVGGDYYDYLRAPDLFVVIGDVSGKGVPAGLVMVMARSILRSLTAHGVVEPRSLAVETNRLLKQDLKPGMFLSLLVGRCDPAAKSIRFAGCGHERPLVYRARTKSVERLALGGLVLGVLPDNSKNVAEAEVALEPGDQVLLYTDGVPEAMNTEGKPFTLDRLEGVLTSNGGLAPPKVLDAVEQAVARHVKTAEPHDDVTLIAIRRKS